MDFSHSMRTGESWTDSTGAILIAFTPNRRNSLMKLSFLYLDHSMSGNADTNPYDT